MSEVKRYRCDWDGKELFQEVHNSGEYVLHSDYEKLKAQLEKCEAALKEYADPETWKNVCEYGVDTWIIRDDQGNLAREYFVENYKWEEENV